MRTTYSAFGLSLLIHAAIAVALLTAPIALHKNASQLTPISVSIVNLTSLPKAAAGGYTQKTKGATNPSPKNESTLIKKTVKPSETALEKQTSNKNGSIVNTASQGELTGSATEQEGGSSTQPGLAPGNAGSTQPGGSSLEGAALKTSSPPSIIGRIKEPEYPRIYRSRKIEGAVTIAFKVDINGVPFNLTVKKTSGFELMDARALDAVKSARFMPAKKERRPVVSEEIEQTFVYQLR